MSNRAFVLLQSFLKRSPVKSTNATANAMCEIIDHYNEQHWHDRDRYGEEIRRLKERIERLEKGRDQE